MMNCEGVEQYPDKLVDPTVIKRYYVDRTVMLVFVYLV